MDSQAVWAASEPELKSLGLVQRGDIICLKTFCMPREDTINQLRETVSAAGKELNHINKKKKKDESRRVYFGWMHFSQGKYKSVRQAKGGGCREISILRSSSKEEILKIATELFFPAGSCHFGILKHMNMELGNYEGEILHSALTLEQYIAKHKFTRTRLYVMTKRKSWTELLSATDSTDEEDENEEINLPIPSLVPLSASESNISIDENTTGTDTPNFINDNDDNYSISNDNDENDNSTRRQIVRPLRYRHSLGSPSLLVGSSDEREELRSQVAAAYDESLRADQEREQEVSMVEARRLRSVTLQTKRASQLLPLPDLSEDHVMISVQHPEKGTVRRIFPAGVEMIAVYNWVGSLCPQPMHFEIRSRSNSVMLPNMIINEVNEIVYVVEVEEEVFNDDCIPPSTESEADPFQYADIEAEGRNMATVDSECEDENTEAIQCTHDIEDIKSILNNRKTNIEACAGRCALVHRRPSSFWGTLFDNPWFKQQKLDKVVTKVVWSGEPCVDEGGPYREFLLTAMDKMSLLSMEFCGAKDCLLFKQAPDSVDKMIYYLLGQLSALSIIFLSRGPQCFHREVVNYMFSGVANDIDPFEANDSELKYHVTNIKNGDNDCLLNANIRPRGSVEESIRIFVKNYFFIAAAASIAQYKQGLLSILSEVFDYPCCMKTYFVKDNFPVTYFEVRKWINFDTNAEQGSNEQFLRESTVVKVEMLLQTLEDGTDGIDLRDFLKFVAAVDRIPLVGFQKKIDIVIEHPSDNLPYASTCGLIMRIPQNISYDKLILGLKEGIGFGAI